MRDRNSTIIAGLSVVAIVVTMIAAICALSRTPSDAAKEQSAAKAEVAMKMLTANVVEMLAEKLKEEGPLVKFKVSCPALNSKIALSVQAITVQGAIYDWCQECQRQDNSFYREIDGLTVQAVDAQGIVHEIIVTSRAEPRFYFSPKEKANADAR
jgi:hypothetical protein